MYKSDIERLLAALYHVKMDCVPNFEVMLGPEILSRLLGKKVVDDLWSIDPYYAVQAAQVAGQDAIPCPLRFSFPEGSITSHQDVDKFAAPIPSKQRARLKAYLKAVQGTRVGVGVSISGPLTPTYMSCGPIPIQSFMYLIYDQPDLIERLMDIYTGYYSGVIQAVADLPFHFFYIGDDVCSNAGPLISPQHLEKYWVPRVRKIVQVALSTEKPVIFHCCGELSSVLPYLVQWGIHAVHPIQPVVNDIYTIHALYGERLTLIGNMDVASILSYGTPQEVAEDTRFHINRLSKNGGYVVASSHSITASVPFDNYMAMVSEAQKGFRQG